MMRKTGLDLSPAALRRYEAIKNPRVPMNPPEPPRPERRPYHFVLVSGDRQTARAVVWRVLDRHNATRAIDFIVGIEKTGPSYDALMWARQRRINTVRLEAAHPAYNHSPHGAQFRSTEIIRRVKPGLIIAFPSEDRDDRWLIANAERANLKVKHYLAR